MVVTLIYVLKTFKIFSSEAYVNFKLCKNGIVGEGRSVSQSVGKVVGGGSCGAPAMAIKDGREKEGGKEPGYGIGGRVSLSC